LKKGSFLRLLKIKTRREINLKISISCLDFGVHYRELMISDFSLIDGKSDIAEIVIPDFIVKGLEISIKDPDLLEALQKLTGRERELILLIHFTGFKPKDISEQMNVVERTIYNQHKKILIKLKNYMEEAND